MTCRDGGNESATIPSLGLRVFLCHDSRDKLAVRDLAKQLALNGFDPWLDELKLLPGQDWQAEIRKAVKHSHVIIVCLSSEGVGKSGFLQKEIRLALDAAEDQPEGTIFMIPLRLEECNIPDSLGRWHYVDLFCPDGYSRLVKALNLRAKSLPKSNVASEEEVEQQLHADVTALREIKSQTRTLYPALVECVRTNVFETAPEIKNSTLRKIEAELKVLVDQGLIRYSLASSSLDVETINRIFVHIEHMPRLKRAVRGLEQELSL